MPARKYACPLCGASDQVEKVSTIYLEGIKGGPSVYAKLSTDKHPPATLAGLGKISSQELYNLSRQLAPPSSGKSTQTRPVHPDTVVIAFSLVLPIFLIGILNQQRGFLIPSLILLACAYGLYFYKRKAVIAKFEREKTAKREEQARIEKGIKSWMKLYYCARDGGVFLPGERELIPLNQMNSFLLGNRS